VTVKLLNIFFYNIVCAKAVYYEVRSPLMCKLNWVVCSIEINDYFYIFD